ncbi:hypothetical protein BU15DRAFT_67139 [Melanogaster broomeanus]|nr:hypothetical protein BU15DRAFT_67139 [Melanogaster broomeanus]
MQVVSSDDEVPTQTLRPRCTAKLSSHLTDANNDATPELRIHQPTHTGFIACGQQQTDSFKLSIAQNQTTQTTRAGPGTYQSNVNSRAASDSAASDGAASAKTIPRPVRPQDGVNGDGFFYDVHVQPVNEPKKRHQDKTCDVNGFFDPRPLCQVEYWQKTKHS